MKAGSIPGDFSTVTDLHTSACLEDGAAEDCAHGHEPTGEKGVEVRVAAIPANII